MDMARSRLNGQLPLSSPLFCDTSKETGHGDDDAAAPAWFQKDHHHLRRKPTTRFWVVLALAVMGTYFCLPSFFLSPSPPSLAARSTPENLFISQDEDETRKNSGDDFTLGGLLSEESDRTACKSKGAIHRFRQRSPYSPSPHLLRKLREYEALHKRCGPSTTSFESSVTELLEGKPRKQSNAGGDERKGECKYVVWIANSGLGNRLVSIASAFLYALLTQRVLLLDSTSDLGNLLCEPFPASSWLLPPNFTLLSTLSANEPSPHTLGRALEQGTLLPFRRDPVKEGIFNVPSSSSSSDSSPPLFLQLDVTHDYGFYDKLFFCEQEQASLHPIPWLFLKSNLYFVPSLYLYLPRFRQELDLLFPQRDATFHHIARYLFFPTNPVWGWITRFYNAYLAKSSQIVGIQVRSIKHPTVYLPYFARQILACAQENRLLPKTIEEAEADEDEGRKEGMSIAVLMTSLLPDYSDSLRDLYSDHVTEAGEVVSVHQPSHEMHQNTQKHEHNIKAWAEICLLSFSNNMITSPMSTFGYVAQGLAGIKPWLLSHLENETSINDLPSPACAQEISMDPCFHCPPYFDCVDSRGGDTSEVLPYIKKCKDVEWGLKLLPDLYA